MPSRKIKVVIKGIKKDTKTLNQPCDPPLLVAPDCGPVEQLNDEMDSEQAAIKAKSDQLKREREALTKRKEQYKIKQASKKIAAIPESMSARK